MWPVESDGRVFGHDRQLAQEKRASSVVYKRLIEVFKYDLPSLLCTGGRFTSSDIRSVLSTDVEPKVMYPRSVRRASIFSDVQLLAPVENWQTSRFLTITAAVMRVISEF